MSAVTTFPWIALAAIGSGIGTVGLIHYLRRHWDRPGAKWFVAALSMQVLWCFAYGTGLLVRDSYGLRLGLEIASWVGLCWIGPPFLAFALDYTGRTNLIRGKRLSVLFAVPVLSTPLVLTNPFHGLVWRNFSIEPALGVAAASYDIQVLGYVGPTVGMVCAGLGVVLLVDAVVGYGPLYRREALAVAFSTVPPSVGLVAWLFRLGPAPAVNFAAVLFVPHVVLDAYAFVGTNMFESNPTTQRVAERTAIDDIPSPILVLDPGDRIVRYNRAATTLFSNGEADPLGTVATDAMDVDDLPTADTDRRYVNLRIDGRIREYRVVRTPLTDPTGAVVGATLVFQDVTSEREREQRLEVLNRVMRHNLRNEMTVVGGFAERIRGLTDDGAVDGAAERIADSSQSLIDIGEKARDFDRLRKDDPSFEPVAVGDLVEEVVAEFDVGHPDVPVETDVTASGAVETDPDFLRIVLSNLLSNAFEHADESDPRVRVTVEASDGGGVTVVVRDNGPGIAKEEYAPIRRGDEDALDHGSGIGLYVVDWSVAAIGGEVAFDSGDDGTTVTVHLPRRAAPRDEGGSRSPAGLGDPTVSGE